TEEKVSTLAMRRIASHVVTLSIIAVAGTGAVQEAGADATAGKALFATSGCASCHGPAGKGDGPAAAALTPRPLDMSDGPRMRALSDAFLHQIIKDGGAAVKRSPTMPPAP